MASAAALFAAWAVLANLRRIARAMDWLARIPRPRLAAFLFCATVATISGCSDGTSKTSEILAVQNDINAYCENLIRGGEVVIAASNLTVRIEKLPTEQQRRESYARWADAVYSIDTTRIPFNGRGNFGWCISAVNELTQTTFLAHLGRSFPGRWKLYIRRFSWYRRQLVKLGEKRPYPSGAKLSRTLSGRLHWTASRENYPKLMDFLRWLDAYNTYSGDYESRLEWDERVTFPSGCETIAPELADDVRKKFEDFLGRAIRPRAKYAADFSEKRRREFPIYVPLPSGIVEVWTEAEARALEWKRK